MPVEKFSMSMTPEVYEQIETRRKDDYPRAFIINRELDRWYQCLIRARASLRGKLNPAEVGLICDACNGTHFESTTIPLVGAEVEDAIRFDHLDTKWEIDGAHLIAVLRDLDLAERYALVDAVERFWAGSYHKEDVDWAAVLA